MIYTALINKAMKITYAAHAGQADKGGIPYIFHPYHLAEQMDNENRICIALLHDVAEDTPITLEQLKQEFPETITDALEALTHDPDVGYYEYVQGVCGNLDASLVKLADILHNMTEDRLLGAGLSVETKMHWRKKYPKALDLVLNAIVLKTKENPNYISEYRLMERLLKEGMVTVGYQNICHKQGLWTNRLVMRWDMVGNPEL